MTASARLMAREGQRKSEDRTASPPEDARRQQKALVRRTPLTTVVRDTRSVSLLVPLSLSRIAPAARRRLPRAACRSTPRRTTATLATLALRLRRCAARASPPHEQRKSCAAPPASPSGPRRQHPALFIRRPRQHQRQRGRRRTSRLLQAQGKLAEADPLFCEVLAGRRETLGDKHPDERLARGQSNDEKEAKLPDATSFS